MKGRNRPDRNQKAAQVDFEPAFFKPLFVSDLVAT